MQIKAALTSGLFTFQDGQNRLPYLLTNGILTLTSVPMIDRALLRTDLKRVRTLIHKKDPEFNVDRLVALDEQTRSLMAHVESLRQQKNDYAQQAKSGLTEEVRARSIAIGKELKEKEALLEEVNADFMKLWLSCPNLITDLVPDGGKEENKVVRTWGKKPTFSFDIKNHVELGTANKWFEFDAAATAASSGFVWYNQEGVRIIYALAMFMLKNNMKHGFQVQLPPLFAKEETLTVSGNFPKFKEEVFAVPADGLFAIPTAEVSLVNKYRDTILSADQLPIRMTAWTSCFRREAGNYGKMERGLIRIHQFEKVELVSITEPEHSAQELERMVACAESILQQLGLHYQVSLLAAQDCSFQSAQTYDIEVWLPGQNRYYEVSSASNCTDFQARRGKMRYRKAQGDKTELVHTLNASSLALPRLMVALLETYQQPDGSLKLPAVLEPYLL